MLEWSANGKDSYQTDLWSPEEGYPDTVDPNCYTTTFEVKSDYVEFTSKRPLDCGNGKYVVQLDNEATWISAWNSGYKLSYHDTNRVMFKCEISSAYSIGL